MGQSTIPMPTPPDSPAALAEGTEAPDLQLTTDDNRTLSLRDLRGRTVVLYFYPKADTSGCTTQACEFRDRTAEFEARNAVVLGVSPDPAKAQAKFKAKHDLPFMLLCDVDHAAAEAYGVWVEKSMYGNRYMGVERSTFVIGPDGTLRKVLRKVKPAGHADEVLALL